MNTSNLRKKFLEAFPEETMELTEMEGNISKIILQVLSKGHSVDINSIAKSLNLLEIEVKKIIKSWPGVYFDNRGNIDSYWGLTTRKTKHRFKIGNITLYNWCSWDSLFIPRLIDKSAQIESADPLSGDIIRLTISPKSGIVEIEPEDSVVSFIIPNTEDMRENVIQNLCSFIHFFTSITSAKEWLAETTQSDNSFILSLQDAYELGLQKNKIRYEHK